MTESVSLAGNGIHLSFGRNKVLRGVDIDAPAGNTVAVIGPSGSCNRFRARSRVDFPEPDGPITATVLPAGALMSTPRSTLLRPKDN